MIALVAAIVLASATPVPVERDITSAPMPRMLSLHASEAAAVDPDYIGPFWDVVAFRKTHSSATAVDANPNRVDVTLAKYGRFVLVMLADNYPLRDARGLFILGCDGVEYYRVDPASGEVLPFDGCVESHKRVLPALSQLPQ